MSFRVSQVAVEVVLLDEHDAPQRSEPTVFVGDASSTALEKAKAFLEELPKQLEA